jgi:hypothetical protein
MLVLGKMLETEQEFNQQVNFDIKKAYAEKLNEIKKKRELLINL